jgi:hypothetical protein
MNLAMHPNQRIGNARAPEYITVGIKRLVGIDQTSHELYLKIR